MASDLPRVRLHDDGRVALHDPGPVPGCDDWKVIRAGYMHRAATVEVTGPGWRDAVIVPLPEPNEIHERAGAHWAHGAGAPDVWATHTVAISGHLLGSGGARKLAAALLAAAAHADQTKAVTTDG